MGRKEKDIELLRARARVSETDVREDGTDGNGYSPRSIEAVCEGGVSGDLTQVDLRSLPSILLSHRKIFPKKVSAIYFALSPSDEVLYIGRAKCLYNRWNLTRHHKQLYLEQLGNVRIAWIEVSDCSLLPEIERALINDFDPPCNGIGNLPISLEQRVKPLIREHSIKMRLNNVEYAFVEKEAERRGITLSQLVRDCMKEYFSQARG